MPGKEVLLEIKLKGCVYVQHYILRNHRESRDFRKKKHLCKKHSLKMPPALNALI